MTEKEECVIIKHPEGKEAKYMDAREYERVKNAVEILFSYLTFEEKEHFINDLEKSRNRK